MRVSPLSCGSLDSTSQSLTWLLWYRPLVVRMAGHWTSPLSTPQLHNGRMLMMSQKELIKVIQAFLCFNKYKWYKCSWFSLNSWRTFYKTTLVLICRLLHWWSVPGGSCLGPRELLPDPTVPQTVDPGPPSHEGHPHWGPPPQTPEHLQNPSVRHLGEEECHGGRPGVWGWPGHYRTSQSLGLAGSVSHP